MADTVIGYSGYDLSEECYEYFENACYIAGTRKSVDELMKDSFTCMGEYRVEPITLEQIMKDYGCSCGEYAMEQEAFDKFKVEASRKGIRFEARHEPCDVPLMIVDVGGTNAESVRRV